jgi:hypothetical protein
VLGFIVIDGMGLRDRRKPKLDRINSFELLDALGASLKSP